MVRQYLFSFWLRKNMIVQVEVKPAKRPIPRVEDQNQNNGCTSNNKKIFVGVLPSTLTEVEFKNYFEQYGAITDSVVMRDKEKNIPRGFGFVTFDSEDAVNDVVLQESFHELKNKRVEVKRAEPKYRIQQKKLDTSDCYNTGFQSYTHPYYIVYYVPNTSAPPFFW
jgi:RNA recognition motif-containing protein